MAKNGKHSNLTLYLILAAIVIGFVMGHYHPHAALKIGFLGDIFLNALFMMVVPLVVASMVTGVAKLGHISRLGTLGIRTIIYYMSTTAISVIIVVASGGRPFSLAGKPVNFHNTRASSGSKSIGESQNSRIARMRRIASISHCAIFSGFAVVVETR